MRNMLPDYPKLTRKQLALELERQRELTMLRLRRLMTYSLLFLLVLNVLCVLAITFFVALGKMSLSEKVMFTLIGETIAHSAASFLTITRFVFPQQIRSS
jgi:hypothetical protein